MKHEPAVGSQLSREGGDIEKPGNQEKTPRRFGRYEGFKQQHSLPTIFFPLTEGLDTKRNKPYIGLVITQRFLQVVRGRTAQGFPTKHACHNPQSDRKDVLNHALTQRSGRVPPKPARKELEGLQASVERWERQRPPARRGGGLALGVGVGATAPQTQDFEVLVICGRN